jgi:ComEC/Rec2-related protein
MKRPLAWPSLLFITGIVLCEVFSWPFKLFMLFGFLLVLAAMTFPSRRELLLGASIVAAGGATLALETEVMAPNDLRQMIGPEPKIVTIRGRLLETPYERFYEERARFLTKLHCTALRTGNEAWLPVHGTIGVVTSGTTPKNLWQDQTVEITGVIAPPEGPSTPGLFDYRAFLRRLDIYYVLRASSPGEWNVLGSLTPPLAERFNSWAKRTLAYGLPSEDEALRLLWAMTLGWKTALSGDVSEPFMRSGTLHVFAISGLHIALIAAIIAGVLRGVRVPRRYCALIVIPVIWFYTAATGWQASAVRSTVMATVFFGSWVLVRPPDLFNSLAAAALIILLFDPQQLFQAGFQLSFAVVFFLALCGSFFRPYQARIAAGDPLIPWEVRPWWERGAIRIATYVTGMVMTAVAAWVGSIPLIAYYFHLFTPVSLIANLVVVPVSGAALASNIASLFFGGWFPFMADIFNNSAWGWMKIMLWFSEWTARWPGAAISVTAPGPFAIALYYLVLVAIGARLFSAVHLRPWLCTGIALLGIGAAVQAWSEHARSTLTVLPLGGGHAIFFDAPGAARDVLIDCGDQKSARITVKPFLQSRGVNQLANVVLTHGDADHVGGFEAIMEYFEPARIIIPAVTFRSFSYRKLLETMKVTSVTPDDTVSGWQVLFPQPGDKFPQADDKSLVLRGRLGGAGVLLLPDLGRLGQSTLLDRSIDLRSEIVIASIPRAAEPVCDALLDRIEPRLIIIVDATHPPEARAREPLRERLARRDVPVLYTTETGAITLQFGKSSARVIPTRSAVQPLTVRPAHSDPNRP